MRRPFLHIAFELKTCSSDSECHKQIVCLLPDCRGNWENEFLAWTQNMANIRRALESASEPKA